jgi:hypothetical protein
MVNKIIKIRKKKKSDIQNKSHPVGTIESQKMTKKSYADLRYRLKIQRIFEREKK